MRSRILVTLLIFALTCTVIAQDLCDSNEVWNSCGSPCYPTCQNPSTAGKFCLAVCAEGCFCKAGFIRNERLKKCVRFSECNA